MTGYHIVRQNVPDRYTVRLSDNTGSTDSSYTDDTANDNQSYAYTVKAINAAGTSAPTTLPLVLRFPGAPANVTSVSSTGDITLSWDPAPEGDMVSGYVVERKTTALADGTDPETDYIVLTDDTGNSNNEYIDVSKIDGETYSYRISAFNAAGMSGEPTTATALTVPSTPTGMSWNREAGSVTLSWDAPLASQKITGYRILRSTEPEGESARQTVTLTEDTGSPDANYTDETADDDKTYFYGVSAINAAGVSSIGYFFPLAVRFPQAPQGLAASAAVGAITLSWDAAPDAHRVTGYRIERQTTQLSDGTKPHTGFVLLTGDTESAAASYTDTSATDGEAYDYHVSAINAAGTGQAAGLDVVAVPTAPQLSASVTAVGDISLSWTAPDSAVDITGYQVLRKALEDTSPNPANSFSDQKPQGSAAESVDQLDIYIEDTGSADTTMTDVLVNDGQSYAYAVRAISSCRHRTHVQRRNDHRGPGRRDDRAGPARHVDEHPGHTGSHGHADTRTAGA